MYPTLRIIPLLTIGVAFLMASCRHHDIQDMDAVFTKRMLVKATYETEWQYPAAGGPNWEKDTTWDATFQFPYHLLKPRIPEGLRVQVHVASEKASVFNVAPAGGIIPFTEGCQSLLFYNNNTEYIIFDELNSLKQASATTSTRSGSGTQPEIDLEDVLESTKNSPDMLYSYYIESFRGSEHLDTETFEVTLRPLVFSYLVQCEFSKGLELIAQASGSLTGMADAVSLTTLQTTEQTASLPFHCTVRPFAVQALVRSFGSPDYQEGKKPATYKNRLILNVRLKDGSTQSFQFDVTQQVDRQPRGGVIRVTDIVLEAPQDGTSHNAGFDVDVSDWGDTEEIPFPLK